MKLGDYLIDPSRFAAKGDVEADALREERALLETSLLEVRFDAVRSTAWLLIDLKGSLFLSTGNTAVVAVSGVRHLRWVNPWPVPDRSRAQWSILGWEPSIDEGWAVRLVLHPSPELEISGRSAEFHVGDVPGGDDPPPAYAKADDRTLADRLAGWSSEFAPKYYTRFAPDEIWKCCDVRLGSNDH